MSDPKWFVIPFSWTGEDDVGFSRVALVREANAKEAMRAFDSYVLDCTEDVWGKHVQEHYDTGSAEHSDPGYVYVLRSCDCGDDDCESDSHDTLSVAIQWDARSEPAGYDTEDDAIEKCGHSDPVIVDLYDESI